MPLLQLIVLAIVQGLTEFIPVSSSAHLALVPMMNDGWEDQGALMDLAVHIGSLGAVLIYFRKETSQLFWGGLDVLRFRHTENRSLFLFLVVATIPTLAVAVLLYLSGLIDLLRSMLVIGMASIGFGILLFIADRQPTTQSDDAVLSWRNVILIGGAQAVALIPGTSRSGITITAARFLGLSRLAAARFSMLLSIPTIMALGLFASMEVIQSDVAIAWRDMFLAIILSFITAYFAIWAFLRLTQSMSFTPFVIYRCLLGIVLIALAVT